MILTKPITLSRYSSAFSSGYSSRDLVLSVGKYKNVRKASFNGSLNSDFAVNGIVLEKVNLNIALYFTSSLPDWRFRHVILLVDR